jgi:hypothetical protein
MVVSLDAFGHLRSKLSGMWTSPAPPHLIPMAACKR